MAALPDSQFASASPRVDGMSNRAILLTSYQTGATRGRNLGMPGYSYDLVAQLFVPLLARWGEVIPVARQTEALTKAEREARQRGLQPIHVSFVACQDMVFAPTAANVIVPAWEFPDVPDHAFDGNPNNNWVSAAHRCDLVLVGGQFTVEALQRAGIRTPIRIVPVPTPDEYFRLPAWQSDGQLRIPCSAYVFPHPEVHDSALWDAPESPPSEAPGLDKPRSGWLRDKARRTYSSYIKPLVPPAAHRLLKVATRRAGRDAWDRYVESCRRPHLDLAGVVYTSIFNPGDGRKNWEDLLTGFIWGLRDQGDATLIVKLVTKNRAWIDRLLMYYRTVGLAHRCKLAIVTDYLANEHMIDLVRASTYYLTTTRAEGNCLPVMNYLAAGRPCVAPSHTAISDYFSDEMGFVVATHPEPAIWPHDNRLRFRTTWGRIVWPSLVEQLRQSYHIARNDRPAYDALSGNGQGKMIRWASVESVWPRLCEALDLLDTLKPRKPLAA
jgi:glycosyltransferase involved in cell wall biosynthesis